jgi:hypothetical protein
LSLADDEAVKGIAVSLDDGQFANQIDIVYLHLQNNNAEDFTNLLKLLRGSLINVEHPNLLLDHDFPKGCDADEQGVVVFNAELALFESLPGANSMSMKAQVSSR